MTERSKKTDNVTKDLADQHSAAFVALVDLVRHMARCAARNDHEGILEAAKEKDKLLDAWKAEQ